MERIRRDGGEGLERLVSCHVALHRNIQISLHIDMRPALAFLCFRGDSFFDRRRCFTFRIMKVPTKKAAIVRSEASLELVKQATTLLSSADCAKHEMSVV